MPRLYLIAFIFCLPIVVVGQSELKQLLRYGDELYDKGDFFYAKKYYDQALEIDNQTLSIQWKYAQILHAYQDYQGAAEYYGKVYRKDGDYFYPFCGLYYAQMLRQIGEYDKAIDVLQKVLQKNAKDKKSELYILANQELKSCQWALKNDSTDTLIVVEQLNAPINSEHSEFPHSVANGKLFFSSLRTDSIRESEEVYSTKYRSQLFMANSDEAKEVSAVKDLIRPGQHVGNGAFSLDSSRYYFSVCDDSKIPYTCQIFVARYSNGVFSNIDVLGEVINTPGANTTQPSIGKINGEECLFFASNNSDGKGGMDIYYSVIKNGNQYSKPKAIKAINSMGDEITPFFDLSTNILYFSSNFHEGFGGFDIFMSAYVNDNFSAPVNLGKPINSPQNDTYYITVGEEAYFASNRVGSMYAVNPTCCSDIYKSRKTNVPDIEEEPEEPIKPPVEEPELMVYLPVLYFHNDIPNPRSWAKTTNLDYASTYVNYVEMRPEYQLAWSQNKTDSLKAVDEIEHLFDDFVLQGMKDLVVFREWLLERLNDGAELEVVIRGFASPLTYTDYNVNLTMRRIQSLVNHLERYENGVFLPYINGTAKNGGRLIFVRMPFGEYAADQTVSADRLDTQNSVFNPRAALERRIEVEAVRVLNQNDPSASVIVDKPTVDLGIVKQNQTIDFEFTLQLRDEEKVEIVNIKSPCDCTVLTPSSMQLNAGENITIRGEFNSGNKEGHIVLPIEITLSNGTTVIVYANVEVR
jgi:tetratricopeptide (TPR) repeat protein